MTRSLLLAALGLLCLILTRSAGMLALPVSWFGADLLLLAVAYAFRRHGIFGKRPDGTLAGWGWLVFWPWLALTGAVWSFWRRVSREPVFGIVVPALALGRRLIPADSPVEFDNVLDLTAELVEPETLRRQPSYRSFPILDGSAPTVARLRAEIERLRPGRTFVHCAQGQGRSALVGVAILLRWGVVPSVAAGLARIRQARPGIRLSREQLACLHAFERQLADRRERDVIPKDRFLGELVGQGKPLAEFTIGPVRHEDLGALCDDLNALGPDFVVEEDRMYFPDEAPHWLRGEATREAFERLFSWPVSRCTVSGSANFFVWKEPPTPPRWPAEIAGRIASIGLTQPGASDEGQADELRYELPDGRPASPFYST